LLETGDVSGVESRDIGGVVPFGIFKGDRGDLTLESLSELGVSEKLLREELGLELSDTQPDLGVSALDEGLEELFFLGDGLSSLYTTFGKFGGRYLIWSMLISLVSPSSKMTFKYLS
jgi:hypothetical protein